MGIPTISMSSTARSRARRSFYADVKARVERAGRSRDHLKILPGALVVVGDSLDEVRETRARLDSLVHEASALAALSIALGVDASSFDPDGPLPEIPPTNASKGGRERAIALAKAENLIVRQLAQRLGGLAGSPSWEHHRPLRTTWRNGWSPRPPTGSTSCSRSSPKASMRSWTRWCRSCSAAASSGAIMKAPRCASISACRARPTASSPAPEGGPQGLRPAATRALRSFSCSSQPEGKQTRRRSSRFFSAFLKSPTAMNSSP